MGRKIQKLLLLALSVLLIAGCSDNKTAQTNDDTADRESSLINDLWLVDPTPGVKSNEASSNDTQSGGTSTNRAPQIRHIPGSRRTPEERAAVEVDIDLTVLSATVLSAEVRNILLNGEDYLGKALRVSGLYYYLHFEPADTYYHLIITKDGDACCMEGLEFKLTGDPVFPDDFPPMQTPIEIDGTFSVHEEFDLQSYYLAVDEIFILEQ